MYLKMLLILCNFHLMVKSGLNYAQELFTLVYAKFWLWYPELTFS